MSPSITFNLPPRTSLPRHPAYLASGRALLHILTPAVGTLGFAENPSVYVMSAFFPSLLPQQAPAMELHRPT